MIQAWSCNRVFQTSAPTPAMNSSTGSTSVVMCSPGSTFPPTLLDYWSPSRTVELQTSRTIIYAGVIATGLFYGTNHL